MTMDTIAQDIGEAHGLSKRKARAILRDVITELSATIAEAEGPVRIPGIGTFQIRHHAAKVVPAGDGNSRPVPARNVIRYRATAELRQMVNPA